MLRPFLDIELQEAARAITSALQKSEKAILKLSENSPQYRLTAESIHAYQIALALIDYERNAQDAPAFSKVELTNAQAAFSGLVARVEKVLPKLSVGTPQHTLATRRIRAFEIAKIIIQEALEYSES